MLPLFLLFLKNQQAFCLPIVIIPKIEALVHPSHMAPLSNPNAWTFVMQLPPRRSPVHAGDGSLAPPSPKIKRKQGELAINEEIKEFD